MKWHIEMNRRWVLFMLFFSFLFISAKAADLNNASHQKYFTLSAGAGQSYGGFGFYGQINVSPRISIHGGAGYFPFKWLRDKDCVKDVILGSIGIKYYYLISDPIYLYADLQYGGIGAAAQTYYDWNEGKDVLIEQKTLSGPSLLFGGELRFGPFGVGAAVGLSYRMTDISWESKRLDLTFDGGLSVSF